MPSPIARRISEFIYHKQLNKQQFAAILGYSSAEKINRLFRKEGAKPGFDVIADMANKFAELDMDWLLTGRGTMLKAQARSSGGLSAGGGGRTLSERPEAYGTRAAEGNDEPSAGVSAPIYVSCESRPIYGGGYEEKGVPAGFPTWELPWLGPGEYRMFEVGDDSCPGLRAGDVVVARRSRPAADSRPEVIPEDPSPASLCVLLVRATGSPVERARLEFRAPGGDREIPPGDILEMWKIEWIVSRFGSDRAGNALSGLMRWKEEVERRLKENGI